MKLKLCLITGLFLIGSQSLLSQPLPSSGLYHALEKIHETKRVLYVAAHPDDENTRLIAYLANETKAAVGYLSLTRGDGGQNLIGPELGIGLGQIRTQELLKARAIDGGRQFFTRAKDFGYSKNPDETLQNWDKETILGDVVWVIRQFQPDIIITRFNTIPGVTHGHHTTSAILAEEAFDLAADPAAFPEQLAYVEPWKCTRIFWNAYNFRGEFEPEEGIQYHSFPVGDLNPLLGQTYSQLAAQSRTMHKSQGFGSTARIGKTEDHIQLIKGEAVYPSQTEREALSESAFVGIGDRWESIPRGLHIKGLIENALSSFDFINPQENIRSLLAIRKELYALEDSPVWIQEKKEKLDALILEVMGVVLEFNAKKETVFPGEEISTELVVNNPSSYPLSIKEVAILGEGQDSPDLKTQDNEPINIPFRINLPNDFPFSQPYWLRHYREGAMYPVPDQRLIGKPYNDPELLAKVTVELEGQAIEQSIPLFYKYNDPVDGEVKQPVVVIPPVDITISEGVVIGIGNQEPELTVWVNFRDKIQDGILDFEGISPDQFRILETEDVPGQKQRRYVVAFTSKEFGNFTAKAVYRTNSGTYDLITNQISYKHIPNLTYFSPAQFQWIQADWKVSGASLGYIEGAGDEVKQVLESLGYEVTTLSAADYDVNYLSQFKAIIVGIRAYNTNQDLASNQQVLMGYVRAGGNLIVQYNTTSRLLTNQLGPYPFSLTRNRVSVEHAPVTADFSHPLLSTPNRLLPSDFEGWVQERGLYFAGDLDTAYQTPLRMNDPGEKSQNGSLIYAPYGSGHFVYTGLSFFRELPAGVPGAIKLFVNLIEQ